MNMSWQQKERKKKNKREKTKAAMEEEERESKSHHGTKDHCKTTKNEKKREETEIGMKGKGIASKVVIKIDANVLILNCCRHSIRSLED